MTKKSLKASIYLQILIAVLIVFIGTAAYAFFSSSRSIGAIANLIAKAGEAYTFTSTSATDFNINLKASDMKEENIGNYVTGTPGTIDVTLTSPEGMITACTYDLLFTWTSSDKYLTPNIALPYTHTDSRVYDYEFSTIVTDSSTGEVEFAERNLSNVNNGSGFTESDGVYSGTIAEDLYIEAAGTSVNKTYNIEARIYILPIIQSNLEGKNMNANIKVANVDCQYEFEEQIDVSTLNYLSTNYNNTIFNLVSKQGVNVTYVDSVYFVDTRKTKPGNEENIAYFKGTDNNAIKAWRNGNNLYIGSRGTVYPGPSMSYAFNYITQLNVIDMNNANMSKVTNMAYMFYWTGQYKKNFILNLGNQFNTSNVTNMSNMFRGTGEYNPNFTLDLGNQFNTSNVTNMSSMFSSVGRNNTTFTLNLGDHFNTSKVTNMDYMFGSTGYNSAIFTLNLGNQFNTSNVTDMSEMFSSAGRNSTNFTLNLGNHFNTSKVTNMTYMFANTGYKSTWTLNLKSINFTKVSNYLNFFTNRSESNVLTVLYDANNGDWIGLRVGSHTGYRLVYNVDGSNNNEVDIATLDYLSTTSNTIFDLVRNQGVITSIVKNIYFTNLQNQAPTDDDEIAFFRGMDDKVIKVWRNQFNLYIGSNGTVYPGPSMAKAFFNLQYLNKVDMNNANTSKVTNMSNMFDNTGSSSTNFTLNLGNQFNTSNVINMSSMFRYTGNRNSTFTLNLGDQFNTSKVTNMSNMFNNTGSNSTIFTLNLGNHFNTANVTTMSYMFFGTGRNSTIFTLNLGDQFNTSKVTNMYVMFDYIGSNSVNFTLNLGNQFNTSNVIDMSQMFYGAGRNSTNFTLNLGNHFNTSKVTDMTYMFYQTGYNSTWTLNLKSFNFTKVSYYSNFFTNRSASNILTVLCSTTNGDFINSRVGTFTGYNIICS